jgi:hypothetical protein
VFDIGHAMLKTCDIPSERLREIYGYWRSRGAGGRLPARARINPLDIPKLLPFVFLVDVERDPQRFRFRLVGTQICTWAGRDTTGFYTDEERYGERGPDISREYGEVVTRRQPMYREQKARRPERDYMYYQKLVLPLSSDGEHVDMLFCATDALAPSAALRAGDYRVIWGDLAG